MSDDRTPGVPPQPRRVFLHVGLPKTGTTYLQDRFWRNRDAMRRQGFLYPGDIREAHFHAAVQLQPLRYPHWVDPRHAHAWERLVDEVCEWPGSALISHELLATASAEQAARALRSLDFAEVHVVCTARDLARQIPSVWQENVKNRSTTAFPDFVESIRDPESQAEAFWEFQNLPRILATWGAELPADHVHVVTTPSPLDSPQRIWERFNSVLGLDPAGLTRDLPTANNSLDVAQLELLRLLNCRVGGEIPWERYESVVKEYLAGNLLIVNSWRGALSLPEQEFGWVSEMAADFVAAVRAAGYDVVGDLGDLTPRRPSGGLRPAPDDRQLLEVALDTLSDIVRTMPKPETDRTAGDRIKNVLRGQQLRLRARWSSAQRLRTGSR